MKLGIASDHRGYRVKKELIAYLIKKGFEITDYGTEEETSVDYPEYAFKLGKAIQNSEIEEGILLCGTGIGMSIAANKVDKVRCAKVDNVNDAKFAKLHNNANVIALSADKPKYVLKDILDIYLNTNFSEEERHIQRVLMIDEYKND